MLGDADGEPRRGLALTAGLSTVCEKLHKFFTNCEYMQEDARRSENMQEMQENARKFAGNASAVRACKKL
jgi:ribosomal protein S9